MTIGVDFDGTIVEHEYPKIGKPVPFAFDVLKRLQEEGHILILWTVREGDLLQKAIDFCAANGITFYAHNKNYPEEVMSENVARKLTCDIFIDDRNIGGALNWANVYKIIKSGHNNVSELERMEITRLPKKRNWFIRIGEAWERARGYNYY